VKLPPPPIEPPICHTVNGLAPGFAVKIPLLFADLMGDGWRPTLRETMRSDERQKWLYGFGRDYDDGRGIVTNAKNGQQSWHFYGLAVDIGDKRFEPGSEPERFWEALGKHASQRALTWGGSWRTADKPHVQFWCEGMHVSPSDHAAALLASGGVEAVWRELHAL